jgi:hypothetical protein
MDTKSIWWKSSMLHAVKQKDGRTDIKVRSIFAKLCKHAQEHMQFPAACIHVFRFILRIDTFVSYLHKVYECTALFGVLREQFPYKWYIYPQ